MILKKTIKQNPRDCKDEKTYYDCALICPICGTNIQDIKKELPTWVETEPVLLWDYIHTKKVLKCHCRNCGCKWEVKCYKGDELTSANNKT